MDFDTENDYRMALKYKIKELKKVDGKFGICRLADYLGIQQSYLSRGLNHPKAHLNEDHFFLLLDHLNFTQEEESYLRLLRDLELSQSSKRRDQIKIRIKSFRLSRALNAKELKKSALQPEEIFALDPTLMLLHIALHVNSFRNNLPQLGSAFDWNPKELAIQLQKLEEAKLVVLEKKQAHLRIKEIKDSQVHFSREHPLTKAHQSLLRQLCQSKLQQLPTPQKESFMVTLSSSQRFFDKYLEAQKRFLNEIQKISSAENSENVYQLNIDFFRWA